MTDLPTDVPAKSDLIARHRELRDRFFEVGMLVPSGVEGLVGRNDLFESTLMAVDRLASAAGAPDEPTQFQFSPFIPRSQYDKIEYLRNFPQLAGLVSSFHGDAKDHTRLLADIDAGDPYADSLALTDLCLTPASCYPVYPTLTGTLDPGGASVTTCGLCFRHEPSPDPMRMQSFRQREHVRVGDPEVVEQWRNSWVPRAEALFGALQIPMFVDVANDAFFGRTGKLLAHNQRELELKLEFLVPVYGDDDPTACASVNLHREHFGALFDIHLPDGAVAHSSCFGFGLERITVALFALHGFEIDRWPSTVRDNLAGA